MYRLSWELRRSQRHITQSMMEWDEESENGSMDESALQKDWNMVAPWMKGPSNHVPHICPEAKATRRTLRTTSLSWRTLRRSRRP